VERKETARVLKVKQDCLALPHMTTKKKKKNTINLSRNSALQQMTWSGELSNYMVKGIPINFETDLKKLRLHETKILFTILKISPTLTYSKPA
jgi:hypothetical protein